MLYKGCNFRFPLSLDRPYSCAVKLARAAVLAAAGSGLFSTAALAIPIRDLPGLQSISIFERSGRGLPTEHLFVPDGAPILTRRSGTLASGNRDFVGVSREFYDAFYSDADGVSNAAGAFLTIEGAFDARGGGGFNIAEIRLNFGGVSEFANEVASFAAFGKDSFPITAGNAIDQVFTTHTTFGSTFESTERLRLTVGFGSSVPAQPVAEPGMFGLFGAALIGIAAIRRRRQG